MKTLMLMSLLLTASCATVIREDEVGVREFLGSFSDRPSDSGLKLFLWPIFDIETFPLRTENIEVALELPSKEGLNVAAEISILYRVDASKATDILRSIGMNYEQALILPVFRSASADVSARFDAKDMHTGKRALIEAEIRSLMSKVVEPRGFIIEAVLMKTIRLPAGLARSIEEKLQAEQDAQRMNFVLDQEKKQAERLMIQAQGVRNSQKTISQGLSPKILQYEAIGAFRELSKSPNTKIIITNGKNPLLMDVSASDKRAAE